MKLPDPRTRGEVSLEEALERRRSCRSYGDRALDLREIGQLLWAAQGRTGREGERTAPSAGALYPLETYLAAGRVEGLDPGVYRYRPGKHDLVRTLEGDRRRALRAAALDQPCVDAAAAVIAFAAAYGRTTGKYGDRGPRYVHMEAGEAAQNVHLQAITLGLGTVIVGAFDDEGIAAALGLPPGQEPLLLMPVGASRE